MNSSLFSHAEQPEPSREAATVADIVLERVVPRELHEAFNGFIEYIHLWWPQEYTEYGEDTHPAFEAGALTETGADGQVSLWATVTSKVQDAELVLDWVAAQNPQTPSEVRISFVPVTDSETRVSLTHTGLGRVAEPVETALGFSASWPVILDRYARFMGAR
ncbi:SRPBCC domain-containing protein [Arthrobacter jiangjiafuii]|uniref:SRPBCC domain-containing protein n=1 Tax=Arthrobacter jiangjiafuii TaxID=2817475 RepID=A0A975M636_9MICC|nr:SRPBCC domain-containing protein [Arthrobacter jiangjiafuii]MBP3045155.1 SRPBCC domain-containing protein [Arthrobacter jiangjiafuii]QWC10530.1 SRPBCC domain-containing protein [Arthrobacter jiangjiafuii]